MEKTSEETPYEKLWRARRETVAAYLEHLPTIQQTRDYRVEVDRQTGSIFLWTLKEKPRPLGCVFRHEGEPIDVGPVWSATARDIVVARGVSREMAMGCLVLALWEAGF